MLSQSFQNTLNPATYLSLPTGTRTYDIASGDFNKDSKADLVAVNYDDNTVSVFLNTGNGRFAAPQIIPVSADPISIVGADFNNDTYPDLATAHSGIGYIHSLSILLNAGNGTFSVTSTISAEAGYAMNMAVGDLNGDGWMDLATANPGANNITLLFNQGNGTFGNVTTINDPVWDIAIRDVTGDGRRI